MTPELTYDITKTWEENCSSGPCFCSSPPLVPVTEWKTFLGMPVRSRLGIAAGLLANSRWMLPFAARGFDILTYKTVRSRARPSYPVPNWVFVNDSGPPNGPVYVTENLPDDLTQVSSAVCFGMPSVEPAEWRFDIAAARRGLGDGQVLIVSVVGTPDHAASLSALADDYAHCAAWAAESGAQVIEANLSCPNVCTAEGSLYHDPEASRLISDRIRSRIGAIPLLLKIGSFPDAESLADFVRATAGIAQGFTLVNCLNRQVLKPDGSPVFGPAFPKAGVLGRMIHRPSVAMVQELRHILNSLQIDLTIVAVGGASRPDDVADFFSAGADAVLFGSAPMYLPNLACELKSLRPEW